MQTVDCPLLLSDPGFCSPFHPAVVVNFRDDIVLNVVNSINVLLP